MPVLSHRQAFQFLISNMVYGTIRDESLLEDYDVEDKPTARPRLLVVMDVLTGKNPLLRE